MTNRHVNKALDAAAREVFGKTRKLDLYKASKIVRAFLSELPSDLTESLYGEIMHGWVDPDEGLQLILSRYRSDLMAQLKEMEDE